MISRSRLIWRELPHQFITTCAREIPCAHSHRTCFGCLGGWEPYECDFHGQIYVDHETAPSGRRNVYLMPSIHQVFPNQIPTTMIFCWFHVTPAFHHWPFQEPKFKVPTIYNIRSIFQAFSGYPVDRYLMGALDKTPRFHLNRQTREPSEMMKGSLLWKMYAHERMDEQVDPELFEEAFTSEHGSLDGKDS